MSRLGLDIDTNRTVERLRVSQRQLVEIAKALSLDTSIIIMDEPTSALSDSEVEYLFDVVRGLREHDVAVIYISHRLDEVFTIADRVTVLRDGKVVGSAIAKEVTRAKVISMMVGRDLETLYPKAPVELGDEVLRVEGLTYIQGRTQGARRRVPDGAPRGDRRRGRADGRGPDAAARGHLRGLPARQPEWIDRPQRAGRCASPRLRMPSARAWAWWRRTASCRAWCWSGRSPRTPRCHRCGSSRTGFASSASEARGGSSNGSWRTCASRPPPSMPWWPTSAAATSRRSSSASSCSRDRPLPAGRADARHRRRCQGRDLPPGRRAGARGHVVPPRLERDGRAAGRLRSDLRPLRRQADRRVRAGVVRPGGHHGSCDPLRRRRRERSREVGGAGGEPMSTRTAEPGMSSQASSRLSLVDVVCLVATVALLVSFVVLPWAIEAGTSVTGLSLLLSESRPPDAGGQRRPLGDPMGAAPRPARHRHGRSRALPQAHRSRGTALGDLARSRWQDSSGSPTSRCTSSTTVRRP